MKSITINPTGDNSTTKRITTGVLQSLTTLWFLCTKQAITASRKLKDNSKISPDSPVIQRPKKLIATLSNKAIKMRHHRKKKDDKDDASPEFGYDGLWQREILMGDKCQPLDFSGVINYDRDGKRTSEFPVRSQRVSSVPAYVAKFDWYHHMNVSLVIQWKMRITVLVILFCMSTRLRDGVVVLV